MQKISSEQTYCIKYIASAWLKLFQKNFNTNNGFTAGEEDALYHKKKSPQSSPYILK